jgi:hypothetical protein
LFVVRARLPVVAIGINTDSAARREYPCYFNVFRFHQGDQIVQDDVYAVFMESAMVTKAE